MRITVEGSINPSTALPRGERMTVDRTDYIDTLIRGGYVVVVAEHPEPAPPVLSETERQAQAANDAAAEAGVQRKLWDRAYARTDATDRMTGADVNKLDKAGLPIRAALAEAAGVSDDDLGQMIRRGEVTAALLSEAGRATADALGVPLVPAEG